jgi:hypothetical protein
MIKLKKGRTGGKVPTMERVEMHKTCWSESRNGTGQLKCLGVGRRILTWILEKQGLRVWIGFI